MSDTTISLIVFACIFGGALCGIFLHAVLPEHHRSAESKDIVKLGMGLVATMAALVLGLLVASAKGSYDAQSSELIANVRQYRLARPGPGSLRAGDEGSARSAARLRSPRARSDVVKRQYKRCAKGVAVCRERNSLRQDAETVAKERHTTRASRPGVEYRDGSRKNALADVRTGNDFGFPAVTDRAGSLAHGYFHQFRSLRSSQRDRGRQLVCLRAVGFRRNLFDPGDVRPLRRIDSRSPAPRCAPPSPSSASRTECRVPRVEENRITRTHEALRTTSKPGAEARSCNHTLS